MRDVKIPDDFDGQTTRDALRLGLSAASVHRFLAIAQAAYAQADLEAAYDAAFLAVSCDRSQVDAWVMFGAVCAQRGAYTHAQTAFKQALEQHPDHLGALTGLGETSIALKDLSGAAQHLQKVVQLDPSGSKEASLRARMLLVSRHQWKLGLEALSALEQQMAAAKAKAAAAAKSGKAR